MSEEGEEVCEEVCEEESEEEGEEEDGEGIASTAEEPSVRRLVLLFNSWDDAPPGTDGRSDSAEAASTGEPAVYHDDVQVSCTPRRQWRDAVFGREGSSQSTCSTALVARLMGTPKRRGSAVRFTVDDVAAPRQALREALADGAKPTELAVRG